ncbi:MAG: transglycosylase domain-containing protein [Candidatus Thiodiazotropha sp. (ex Cardiolucina cf. quadrata)]|nr:transglycosylase domain-containing protein [Candidatus Thiodiazotropha sp. (ex Cardiolucina cf. quadrata)]
MKLKKIISRSVIVGFAATVAIIAYYTWELRAAYQYTIDRVLPLEIHADYPLQVSSLTERQLDILLKIEDPKFFEHMGIDFSTPGAGITTITQGLVKHIYFDKFKSGIAKIKQSLIARYVLDPLMSKEMQLRRFINTVYLGSKIRGFEQAANYYFNKKFEQLNEDQYITIVAMIIAPTTFSIEKHPKRNKDRVTRIKQVIKGEYKPKGLCDLYYGRLDQETQQNLAPFSYFESYYE